MAQTPSDEGEKTEALDPDSDYRKHNNEINRMMLSGKSLSGQERNCAFLNLGDGTFATASSLTGFDVPDDSRAVALCDWDHDGRLDALLSARTAPRVRFFHNEHRDGGDWMEFRLTGGGPINRDAIGTRLELRSKGAPPLVRHLRAGTGYLSQSQKLLHFGLGRGKAAPELLVVWPDGKIVPLGPVERNRAYTLSYPDQLEPDVPPALSVDLSSGAALPAIPFSHQGEWRLVYPVPLPPLKLEDQTGQARALPPLPEGSFRLINLWNPSCVGCVEELRALTAASPQLKTARLEVVTALGPGETGFADSASVLREMGAPFPFGRLSSGDAALFRLILQTTSRVDRDLLPTSFLVDANDLIVAIYRGPVTAEMLLADVESLRSAPRLPMTRSLHLTGEQGHWITLPEQANMFYILFELMEQGRLEDADQFIRKHSALVNRHKKYGQLLLWMGDELTKLGRTDQALLYYLNGLQQGSSDPDVMNNVAWQLATNPDPRLRNGAQAVQWAEKAVQLSKGRNPSYLDTLAAAFAERGDFQRALATVDQASKLAKSAGATALLPGLEKARRLYRAGRPYRD